MRRYGSNQNLQKNTFVPQTKKIHPDTLSPKISRNQNVISPRFSRNISIAETIRSRNLEKQQKETNKALILQKNPSKKFLPFVITRLFKNFLIYQFTEIKTFMKIKQMKLSLLQSKLNKNLNFVFLRLKYYFLQKKMQKITQFNQKSNNPKILFILLNKYMKKLLTQSFIKIKQKSYRKTIVFQFINKIHDWYEVKIQTNFQKQFNRKLSKFYQFKIHQDKYTQRFNSLHTKLKVRFLYESFMKILNYSFYFQHKKVYDKKTENNKEIMELLQLSIKSVELQRKNLKKLKNTFDTINLQKNRSLNQLKNARLLMKQNKSVDVKTLLQQQNLLEEDLQNTINYHKQLQKKFQKKSKKKENAQRQNFIQKVCKLYDTIKNNKNEQINMAQNKFIKKILTGNEIGQFKQNSHEYLFYENLQLLELIHSYENVKSDQKYQTDPDYLRKIQENHALKKILGTLIEKNIENLLKIPNQTRTQIGKKIKQTQFQSKTQSPKKKKEKREEKIFIKQQRIRIKSKSHSEQTQILSNSLIKNPKNKQSNIPISPRNIGKIISRATYSNNQ